MRIYLKKEFGLIERKRLSHIWHMTTSQNSKPIFITDGALNVAPRIDVKMHILNNAIDFAKKINISKPRVAVLSGTEDPIESMPSSMEAKEIMERAKKENIELVFRLPPDSPFWIQPLVNKIQPAVLILIEAELWPALLWECQRQNIPVILVNGRISKKSVDRYSKFLRFFQVATQAVSLFCMRSEEDAERAKILGIDPEKQNPHTS